MSPYEEEPTGSSEGGNELVILIKKKTLKYQKITSASHVFMPVKFVQFLRNLIYKS